MNYKAASAHCRSLGSQLAPIQNKDENTFVRNLSNKLGLTGYLWTAVQKLCSNCTQTVSGYVNWLPGKPSDVSNCVMMYPNGEWRDIDCAYTFPFVCRKGLAFISVLALQCAAVARSCPTSNSFLPFECFCESA